MKQQFEEWNPTAATIETLSQATAVIDNYRAQGFTLSLRQLYYQLVSKDLIPNEQRQYKRLGTIVTRGRLAGLIDWNIIEDRGRTLNLPQHWDNPGEIVAAAARSFKVDKWEGQDYRVYVLCEKDALSGVLGPVCTQEDVYFSACKGYASISHVYKIGQSIAYDNDQSAVILYFGDHDPSGMDMDRDLFDRITLLSQDQIQLERLALTMSQIEEYNPPPNPAKLTDSRAPEYISIYGDSSWELDAMAPEVLADLARNHISQYRDDAVWADTITRESEMQAELQKFADTYEG